MSDYSFPSAAITPEEIVYLYSQRYIKRGPLIQAMERVRDAYNGDIVIPLPELSKSEAPSVPNLVAQGIDQTAMRIASTLPDITYYPDRPGFKKWEELALDRRKVNLSWWDSNSIPLKMRRRARWLLAYACSPVLLLPDRETASPKWHIRNPLATFPADTEDPDDITPPDAIFAYTRTHAYIARHYPDKYAALKRSPYCSPDDRLVLLDYVSANQLTTICLSSQSSTVSPYKIDATVPYSTDYPRIHPTSSTSYKSVGSESFFVISSIPNRTNLPLAVVPGRITLDREQGGYDGIVGMFQTMAMLFALEIRAVIQGVWPDTWAIARPNETTEIIQEADGRRGIIGKLQGGDIKTLVENPGYMTNPTLDRLEAYERTGAGIPSEFGGQSPTNVRTGRRGQDVISAAIDFPIQEAQILFEKSLEAENTRAAEIDKAYFGPMRKSVYLLSRASPGTIEYTPSDLWTSTRHSVSYSLPGADYNNQVIVMGQKRGLELISKRTALEMDPQIEDVEAELDRISAEKVEDALWAWVQQQIATGTLVADDVSRLYTLVVTNRKSPSEALSQVQLEAQVRQSQNVAPVNPGDPLAQPGLSPPGAGAEAGVTVPPPTPSLENLRSSLAALYPAQRGIQRPA